MKNLEVGAGAGVKVEVQKEVEKNGVLQIMINIGSWKMGMDL